MIRHNFSEAIFHLVDEEKYNKSKINLLITLSNERTIGFNDRIG